MSEQNEPKFKRTGFKDIDDLVEKQLVFFQDRRVQVIIYRGEKALLITDEVPVTKKRDHAPTKHETIYDLQQNTYKVLDALKVARRMGFSYVVVISDKTSDKFHALLQEQLTEGHTDLKTPNCYASIIWGSALWEQQQESPE